MFIGLAGHEKDNVAGLRASNGSVWLEEKFNLSNGYTNFPCTTQLIRVSSVLVLVMYAPPRAGKEASQLAPFK